jgi:hypothetical protein
MWEKGIEKLWTLARQTKPDTILYKKSVAWNPDVSYFARFKVFFVEAAI